MGAAGAEGERPHFFASAVILVRVRSQEARLREGYKLLIIPIMAQRHRGSEPAQW